MCKYIYIYNRYIYICIAAHIDIRDTRSCLCCCPWKKSITTLACLMAENWALLPAPRELWMLEELASLDTLHVSATMAASCSTDQHVISAIWWIFQQFSDIVPPKFCVKTTRCEGCHSFLPRWRCFFGLSKHHRCGGCEVAYNWAGQREIAWENAWERDDYGGKLGRQT